jgi:hypothetical protein
MKFTAFLAVLLSASAITACAAQSDQIAITPTETPAMTEPAATAGAENRISATGSVRFIEINGGFWGIVGDDGRRFDPMGLDAAYQKEGLRVRFEATPETDMMSTRMWGTMVTLTKIEPIE